MYRIAAAKIGDALVRHQIGLVYGGGAIGLMRIVADTVLRLHGDVVGVVPNHFISKQQAHTGVKDLRVVATMHERKRLMAEMSDGFVALPGGFGTLEEFCEAMTWAQLALHQKPCGILNVNGYFDLFLGFLDHAVEEGFLMKADRARLICAEDPEELIAQLITYMTSGCR